IVLSYEALAEEVTAEQIVEQVQRKVPAPHLGYGEDEDQPAKEERILRANTNQPVPSQRRWWSPRGKKRTGTADKRK
ncbi:MAG: hypothetical protein HY332_12150, partial [Chloroflexi bacterium]|nr:hypothetical protein [Chloroflexota bacterium]